MSAQAWSYVVKNSHHKGGALLLLLMIANHAHADGTNAFPSVKTLAAECRMSIRQVIRLVALLEKSGELIVERSSGRRSHNYAVNMACNGDKMSGSNTDKMSLSTLTSKTPNPDICDTSTLTFTTNTPYIEPSVETERERSDLLTTTEKVLGFVPDLMTQDRITQVVPERFEAQWLSLIKNRMLGNHGAARNYLLSKLGYWLTDFENNIWRYEKDLEVRNGNGRKPDPGKQTDEDVQPEVYDCPDCMDFGYNVSWPDPSKPWESVKEPCAKCGVENDQQVQNLRRVG